MLALVCAVQSRWSTRSCWRRGRRRGEVGQAVAEYALLLLGVSAIALLVAKWAGGTDRIEMLLDAVLDQVLDKVR